MKDYEFSSKKYKAVATVVDAVPSEEVVKAVAEEIKAQDPVNASEIIEEAKAKKEPKVKKESKEDAGTVVNTDNV